MQITTCKNQQNHTTLSKDIDDLLVQRTLGMPNHTQLKQHDNNDVASMDVELTTCNKYTK